MRARSLALLSALWLGWTAAAIAGDADCRPVIARVVSSEGLVELRRSGDSDWHPAAADSQLCAGDALRAGRHARAAVALADQSLVRLDALTTLTLSADAGKPDRGPWLDLLEGIIHLLSREPMGLTVDTPFVNAAVEGTEFIVSSRDGRASVLVLEGRVRAANARGAVELRAAQMATATARTAPAKVTVARPFDAVHWALYYPPVIIPEAVSGGALTEAIERFRAGDVDAALGLLEQVPPPRRDASHRVLAASLLLRVGRVSEAQALLERTPESADTLALGAIIALARGRSAAARALARDATDRDPGSAPARLALSYVLQGAFELQGALAAAERAVELAPDSALVRARLAELQLALGQRRAAVDSARRAVALDPVESRAHTTLGFARLLQHNARRAQAAFARAIALDAADPLPRLGLGLSKIRRGDLHEGRAQIEIAVSLDPANAILRSYLGKAYFDERRAARAATQYELAKALDGADPTPWFYEAILDQTTNRPVEALDNLQGSIARNDNRAVYRSRLALDADLAARSASLARVYRELGFAQRALVEGYESVNTDPTSFSGHRFLSQTYSVLPRHEIARTAELLQSQLWQPLNVNPLPPQLAQTDLAIVEGTGPSMAGGNELNPLFARDRIAFQGNLVVGQDETLGDDLVLSGLLGKLSFALGQFHYETDGWRENADQEQDLYSLYLQGAPSERLSLQLELRSYERERGDVALRFDPQAFSQNLREARETDTARFGLRYDLSPRSHALASVIGQDFQERDDDQVDFTFDPGAPFVPAPGTLTIEARRDDTPLLAELQHVLRADRYHLQSGVGWFDSDRRDTITTVTESALVSPPLPPMPFVDESTEEIDASVRHTNAYLYSRLDATPRVSIALGLGYDDFEGLAAERRQWNPKLGVTWRPATGTTVRAAALRALKRDLVTDQTIEPTQVAGFNQFFDDPDGTDSRRYGAAVDQRIGQRMFAGIELTARSMDVPFVSTAAGEQETEWEERLHRAYWNWAPTARWALSAEYLYERLEYSAELPINRVRELETQRLPLSARYFWRNGISAGLTASFIVQEGEFTGALSTDAERDDDRFWNVDATVSYRLPKRYGVLSLIAKNLLDEELNFQEPDPENPTIYPERLILGRVTVSF